MSSVLALSARTERNTERRRASCEHTSVQDDSEPIRPTQHAAIEADTQALGFSMGSDARSGSFLRTLAASKPSGSLLELGTGTGLATCWLLEGMDHESSLLSVDSDETVLAVARKHLDEDPRVSFVVCDGGSLLPQLQSEHRVFDLVFADAWPGKYSHLDEALALVGPGGLYVVDDMLPQPTWPVNHGQKAAALVSTLSRRSDFRVTALDWSTGLVVAARSSRAGTEEGGSR